MTLDRRLPIANAILTVKNAEQAWAPAEDSRNAETVAVEMAQLLKELK